MDRLNRSKPNDGVSEMLRSLRVRTTIFCRSDMRAPWGFGVRAHGRAAFHVLLEGSCALDVEGVEEPIKLAAGDLVVLPRGPGHTLRSDRDAPVEWLDDILHRTPPVDGRLRYGGRGVHTDLICGVFAIEDREAVPILTAIPTVALVRREDGHTWLGPLLEIIKVEVASFAPGGDSVVARLADVLMLQAIRHELEAVTHDYVIFDSQVGTALRLMREEPDRAWTIGGLARAVSCSRTSLVERFRLTTGMPPMRYLTRLRIATAARELGNSAATLAEIAPRVGYSSDIALSKAFRREMGVTASDYRVAALNGRGHAPGGRVNGRASK
ncbi:MAG: AraC family transcriptional regulator [Chloroflexi bacterium]|nr:MAG: AraC family transcriptional regulator [Chloroflexota bacterium]